MRKSCPQRGDRGPWCAAFGKGDRHMRIRTVIALAGFAAIPAVANAQWTDNFDSYIPGSINAQGGWKGWDNAPSAAGTVSTARFLTAPHSQAIGGVADSVHEYSGYTSGTWTYSAMQYVPTGVTGTTYLILLNTYVDGGANTVDRWSLQARFNLTTGLVDDDTTAAAGSPGTTPRPIIRDQWVPFSATIDLSANTLSWSYNNQVVWSGSWTRGTAGANNAIAAVDLFNLSSTGDVYYDNISLVPAPGAMGLLAMGGLLAARRRRA